MIIIFIVVLDSLKWINTYIQYVIILIQEKVIKIELCKTLIMFWFWLNEFQFWKSYLSLFWVNDKRKNLNDIKIWYLPISGVKELKII